MEQFAFQQPPKNKQQRSLCVDDDKLFHTRGPATQNARSLMVVSRALGMSSMTEAEDRSHVLTPDTELNLLLFYIIIYRSYKLSKTEFFGPRCILRRILKRHSFLVKWVEIS